MLFNYQYADEGKLGTWRRLRARKHGGRAKRASAHALGAAKGKCRVPASCSYFAEKAPFDFFASGFLQKCAI